MTASALIKLWCDMPSCLASAMTADKIQAAAEETAARNGWETVAGKHLCGPSGPGSDRGGNHARLLGEHRPALQRVGASRNVTVTCACGWEPAGGVYGAQAPNRWWVDHGLPTLVAAAATAKTKASR